jgi:hypothetical protein
MGELGMRVVIIDGESRSTLALINWVNIAINCELLPTLHYTEAVNLGLTPLHN